MPPSGQRRLMRQAAPSTWRGIFGFALALVGRAVRAQLAACQVAETDAIAARRMDGHGSGQADLDVVGMRAEGEEVDGLEYLRQFPTSKSQRPRHSQLPNFQINSQSALWELAVPWRLHASARAAMAQIRQTSRPTETLNMAMRTSRRRTPQGCRRAGTSHELSCNEPIYREYTMRLRTVLARASSH